MLMSCTTTSKSKENSEKHSETKELRITRDSIISSFAAQPDSSVNIGMVKEHFEKYPDRWITAFTYLAELDTARLKKGRTDLNENVYVSYNEYTTKNKENAFYESHKQYIDIQYMIEGEEYIALTHNCEIPIKSEYNEIKDISFYNFDGGKLLRADPCKYFIFFPTDIHKPCIKINENSKVKKIVVKVKFN